MTGSTLHVIRLALMHDIHRHQKALDRTNATETAGGEDHRYAISDLRAAVADLEPRRRHRRRLPIRSA